MHIHLLVFCSSLIYSQNDLTEWKSISSSLTPTEVVINQNDNVYASTSGGILEFDELEEKFNFIQLEEGLNYLDLTSISIDSHDRLWVGSAYPRGCLQVYDSNMGLVAFFEDELISSIKKIIIGQDIVFSVYEGIGSGELGILKFELDELGLPDYKDYYNDISDETITEIYDLDMYLDSIYVTTDQGIFVGSILDNLKFSSNWMKINDDLIMENSIRQYIPGEISFLLGNGAMFTRQNGVLESYCDGFIGNIMQASIKDDILAVLTEKYYHEFIDCEINSFQIPVGSQENTLNSFGHDFRTTFTSFTFGNDANVVIGIKDNGILIWNRQLDNYEVYTPNTPLKNEFHAIAVTNSGLLAATSHFGTLIHDGINHVNFIPENYYSYYNGDSESFHSVSLDYQPGDIEHVPISILEKDNGNLFFCNSGTLPNRNNGTVIELNYVTNEMMTYDDTDGIIDGWGGIYVPGADSHYMLVNQIVKDDFGNMWIVNPYCEQNGHLLAIQSVNDGAWSHIRIPDENSYRPQTIALEQIGTFQRTWIGFAYDDLDENTIYSEGGIKVLSHANYLSNDLDTTWLTITNPSVLPGNDDQASVWSLVFDKMGWLWVMNEKGIRGYTITNNFSDNTITLDPVAKYLDGSFIDYLGNISFVKGNRIKVDSQNNKWIITHQGVWVIEENMLFWPTEEGINSGNSALLSNTVHDMAFNDQKGLAYFATNKGISILQVPFAKEPSKKQSIYISPNPFIISEYERVRIGNVPSGSSIQIMTISGLILKSIDLDSNESFTYWNGTDMNGDYVGSAVYLVSSKHPHKSNRVSKISVIR